MRDRSEFCAPVLVADTHGPYPERPDPDPWAVDEWLTRAFSQVAPAWTGIPRSVRRLERRVAELDHEMRSLGGDRLQAAADELRIHLAGGRFPFEATARAFALAREATARHLSIRHHPVQVMGGAALLSGALAEMNTGEGKTITALLPAVVAGLAGLPVHVVTVNDYLARRDAEQLSPIYASLGLSVGLVQHGQAPALRRNAYRCDVTYCTNKELAFDYLRDRIVLGRIRSRSRVQVDAAFGGGSVAGRLLLRGLCFAIVDEADSVLVDEARVPLLISGEVGGNAASTPHLEALAIAESLRAGRDFTILEDQRTLELTPAGKNETASLAAAFPGVWQNEAARLELVQQALTALHLFERDKHYILAEDKVQIVDEYTGRVMADRQWERGLHQLIEAKEGLSPSGHRETLARITYQRFFGRYVRLCGMSGTLAEVRPELRAVYGARIVRIPPNRKLRRSFAGIAIYRTAERKWHAVERRIETAVATGRPVLVGTRSVAASELIAGRLEAANVAHEVLNARQDAQEAEIVGRAGRSGAATVATNMAGRGTDILLDKESREAGGLHVILTEFHESARIDRQLYGRCGRQGDPGSYEMLASLEDELFTRFSPVLTEALRRIAPDPLPFPLARLLVRIAQRRADSLHARVRRENIRHDRDLDKALAFAGTSE